VRSRADPSCLRPGQGCECLAHAAIGKLHEAPVPLNEGPQCPDSQRLRCLACCAGAAAQCISACKRKPPKHFSLGLCAWR